MTTVSTQRAPAALSAAPVASTPNRETNDPARPAIGLARDTAGQPLRPVGTPSAREDVLAAVGYLNGIVEGLGALLMVQSVMRSDSIERSRSAADSNEERSAEALEQQQQAHEAAASARARASRLRRAPRWVKKLIAAVITAAGAVAGAFTGGAAAGLAIVGAVLILAGEHLPDLLVKAGVDPERAAWTGLALKLAGTALSLGAGAAGGAATAGSTAAQISAIVERTTRIVSAVHGMVEAGLGGAEAVFTFRAADLDLEALEHGLTLEETAETQSDLTDFMRQVYERYARTVQRAEALLQTRDETQDALLAHISA